MSQRPSYKIGDTTIFATNVDNESTLKIVWLNHVTLRIVEYNVYDDLLLVV